MLRLRDHALEATYSEVVHWRLNSFKVPPGKAGKEFVQELSRMFHAFATASTMESVALRATIACRSCSFKSHTVDRRQRTTPTVWREG